MKDTSQQPKMRTAGLTLIELLISIAVGSLVLMMLMQMVVMNVAAKRKYEYENFVTNQSLLITDQINRNLIDLQTHHFLVENGVNTTTVTFSHQFDIVALPGGGLTQSDAFAAEELLVYDEIAQTLTYDGQLLHPSSIKILPGTTITALQYFDPTYDPNVCSDYLATRAEQICGDGILELTLVMAVLFNSGELGDAYTFTTRIII